MDCLATEKNWDLKELDIFIETVTTKDIKEDSLFELSDSVIIASISKTFPSLAQFATQTVTNIGLENVNCTKG